MKAWARTLVILLLCFAAFAHGAEKVATIKIEGTIGPTTASFIARAISEAEKEKAQCLIIQLDTPGGLLESTKTIVQSFLASPVPTVVFVSPSGGTATSAGCFITLAADVAAMAPATTIGAAHPVQMGGGGGGEEKTDDTMKEKMANYAISYIETIAEKRHRNVEWARSSVKESASITADKALELKVVELIATDMNDLLNKLHDREVNGKKLNTSGATIVDVEMSVQERVFQMLWRPEVMFILMLVAVYGIMGELSNPGAIIPGVLGVIALIISLYMAAVLPVNIAGLALIALALALFVADAFTPTNGILTAGGAVAFLLGSLMLFDSAQPYFSLSLGYIIPATIMTVLFFVFIVGKGLAAQRAPARSGAEMMIGQTTAAVAPIDATSGKIFIEGEYWNAVSDTPIAAGQPVEIVSRQGLVLHVKPKVS